MAKWSEERKQAASEAMKARLAVKQEVAVEAPVVPIEEPIEREGSLGFLMSREDRIQSMLNAVKILPPNLIKDGRHTRENVQALNCFTVTDAMMDEVYKDFKHDW
jgi:hypothetical protein